MRSENDTPWTEELPHCNFTGCGEVVNQIYREDGAKLEGYKCRDRRCYCKISNEMYESTYPDATIEYRTSNYYMYAIFSGDGHNGHLLAESALQTIAANILLGQLNADVEEEEIINILK